MKTSLVVSLALLFILGASAVVAEEAHVTPIPPGVEPAEPTGGGDVECDVLLRYDDGGDNQVGSGSTLGGSGPQFLGIIATPPGDNDYLVQSVGFFSEFWVTPGNVPIYVEEISNPANNTTEVIYVNDGGIWEADLSSPIVVGPSSDFSVMLCPDTPTHGVTGEDTDPPIDNRSYFSNGTLGCAPVNPMTSYDLMIWACVTPYYSPVETNTWGVIKCLYK